MGLLRRTEAVVECHPDLKILQVLGGDSAASGVQQWFASWGSKGEGARTQDLAGGGW